MGLEKILKQLSTMIGGNIKVGSRFHLDKVDHGDLNLKTIGCLICRALAAASKATLGLPDGPLDTRLPGDKYKYACV